MPWPFLAALAAIGEAAGTGAAAAGGSTLGGLGAGMSAGLAGGAAGTATGAGSTLAGVGAGAAMGAGAGGLASAAGSGVAGAGSALTPAINSAANGTMQMAPLATQGSTSGLFSGSAMPATYQAAIGNSTAGAVPMSSMKPLGSSMPQSLADVKPLASGRFDYQDIASRMGQGMQGGGGEQRGPAAMPAPGLMRGLMTPFTPMAFSPANYRFRRGPGF